ncbi:MAG: tRNA 2-thiouridine(34) synthase MnmA [Selenomonadaceae bacterium]|nr:tRNA 2-thiouridine(34) synthase MnmA [Selenomonadaceae bacterium]
MKKKVAVAMSGGVDSSLTAAILLERGFDVLGITMKLNSDEKNILDAQKVCNHLGISHYVADFKEIFRAEVENYFVAEYLRGRTPNPCVRCNLKIKFGALFDFASDLGAEFFSTGHYARIIFEDGRFKLKKAVDVKKDQSYVLYNLTADKLSKILLPLGDFSKVETRALAEKLNLPVADKPDSQEICFVPDDDYKNFILSREPAAQALKSGEIVDSSGKVLGNHHGVANYTIGQRKGLGIAAPQPLYVTKIDVANKKVVVGTNDNLFTKNLTAHNAHWIYKPPLPKILTAKIRYGAKFSACTVTEEENSLKIIFSEPQRAITPGQSIVFYDGDEVLGGAIIN